MSKKEIISTNQFVWMLFSIITSFTTLQIPGLLIFHAGRDAWLSVIIAWFLDVLLAIVYAYMGIRFPGENFVQYSITILGKYFGRIVGIMFPIYFLLVASTLMRFISILINDILLPRTPMEVVIFSGYLLIAYGVKKGIEVVGRACEILAPIYLLSFILLFLFVTPLVKINRLKPQLIEGFYPVLSGSIFILAFIGICIMMGMYIPICNRPENGFIAKFIAVSIGASVVSILVTLCVAAFGAEQAGNMINPGLRLAQLIKVETNIERLESIWFIVAIGAGTMTTIILIWSFCVGISQILDLSSYRPIVYPSILVAFVFSITSFERSMKLSNFAFYTYPFIGMFIGTGLEMFLFIMAIILKKRGNIV